MLWSQLKWVISFSITPNKDYLYYEYYSGKLSHVIWVHCKADSGNRVSLQHPCFSSSMFVSKYFPRSLVMDWSHWLCGREGTNRQIARVKTLCPWQLLEGKSFLTDVPIVYPHGIKAPTVGKKTGSSFMKRKLNWKSSWVSWHPHLISAGCL